MPRNAPTGPEKGEEATVGLKSDLKTLQQLTSSAEAAKRHRDDSAVRTLAYRIKFSASRVRRWERKRVSMGVICFRILLYHPDSPF